MRTTYPTQFAPNYPTQMQGYPNYSSQAPTQFQSQMPGMRPQSPLPGHSGKGLMPSYSFNPDLALNPYDDNIAYGQPGKSGHIKKVKSSEYMNVNPNQNGMMGYPHQQNIDTYQSIASLSTKLPQKSQPRQQPDPQLGQKKPPFIEPGTCCPAFEQILSTTVTNQNGITTYLTAKALTGPALAYASQQCNSPSLSSKQGPKKSKQLPQLPKAITGQLLPHLYQYSTITHEGLYRKQNQDKLTIYLQEDWKWFAIFDGHGGTACSQFMKQHLHQFFFSTGEKTWQADVPNALRKAFLTAQAQWKKKGDNSGTCALVIFIYHNICYVANLGDSRALLVSSPSGSSQPSPSTKFYQITKDHKPSNPSEQARIMQAGGKIYQTTAITQANGVYDVILGPLRVFPGRLSTTRTFGDFQAKSWDYITVNKEPNQPYNKIVLCEPQITSFEIDQHDMIIMGSDGLWDKMDNLQIIQIVQGIKEDKDSSGQDGCFDQQWFRKSAQTLLQQSLKRGSTDNISIIIIGLSDPLLDKVPKKGNQHIKIMGSLNSNSNSQSHSSQVLGSSTTSTIRKRQSRNKQNNNHYSDKIKEIDSRILQINRNASKLAQSRR